jgi:hypothetical protein
VISIEMVMLAGLGFLVAALLTVFLSPLYKRRVARLTTEAIKRSMPITEAEIRADKDRLRAEYAIRIHKLEMKVEESTEASARQMVELNRRDAAISDLEGQVSHQRSALEEHENARRVLEQTIMDRLPKVEHRLAEARKLLFQRDREIVTLSQGSEKQARALDEATQINTQQTDEIHRLKAALNTRAARNREGINDPRFDGEVALRTEIEVLRSKTRNQAAMIARLQALVARAGPAAEAAAAHDELAGENGMHEPSRPAKVVGKRKDEADALKAIEKAGDAAPSEQPKPVDAATEAEIRKLKAANQDQAAEISRLKAALKTYESADKDERGIKDSKISLKARLSALQALSDEQGSTIQSLRAEVAAGNERLARQAAYFMEEMRRLGAGTVPASGPGHKSAAEPSKRPLVERINDPRVARLVRAGGAKNGAREDAKGNTRRVSGFLKALDGDSPETPPAVQDGDASASAAAEPDEKKPQETAAQEPKPSAGQRKPSRKARLLERITGLDKDSA